MLPGPILTGLCNWIWGQAMGRMTMGMGFNLAVLGALLVTGGGLVPEVAAQTGFVRPDRSDGVAMDGAKRCPSRWRETSGSASDERAGHCYPQYANSPSIQRRSGSSCPSGYGVDGEWCSQGHVEHPQLANPNVMAKANQSDRCPAGFYTYMDKCTTELARPPKARVKGGGACRAGEIAEWGIWCTSDFDHLSVQDIRSAHYRDWNDIYTLTRGGKPRQGPDSEDASEVYRHMFGDDRLDGPVGSANGAMVRKETLTAEQRRILSNANAATAAMLPPEGAAAASGAAAGNEGSNQESPSQCDQIKLRGKLGQLARRAAGC